MKTNALFSAAGIAILMSTPALGKDTVDENTTGEFESTKDKKGPITLTLAPYGWVPTLDGTTALGPLAVPVHVTPKDFADGIKIGGMGYVRLDTNRGFVYAETIIADYDNPSFRPFFNQSLRSKVRFYEIGVGINRDIRLGGKTHLKISPYIGVHNLKLGSFVTGNLITTTADGNWTNPVAGITAELPVKGRFSIIGKIDAAGFGATDTDYRNAAVLIDYRISNRISLDLGYRHVDGNFNSTEGLALNLNGGGPIVALRYNVPIRH